MEFHNSISNYNFKEDNGTVAVFSDFNLRFTPMGCCSIPPPMCLQSIELKCDSPFTFYWWKNILFVLGFNTLIIISNDNSLNEYKIVQTIENQIFDNKIKFFIFLLDKKDNIGFFYLVKSIDDSNYDLIVQVKCKAEFSNNLKGITILSTTSLKIERIFAIFPSMLYDELYDKNYFEKKRTIKAICGTINPSLNLLNDNSNEIFPKYDYEGSSETTCFYIVLLQNKQNLISKVNSNFNSNLKADYINPLQVSTVYDIVKIKSVLDNNSERVIYQTKNNRLYIDDYLYALDITSFEIFKNFLFLSQTSNNPFNYLHIIDINKGFNLNSNNKNNAVLVLNENSFGVRRIERGAWIVTVSKINVTIQTPRGNIETFYPRPLVLYEIIDLMERKEYLEAFELCRKHKINYNFIYDVNPEGFLENIQEIVRKVKRVY